MRQFAMGAIYAIPQGANPTPIPYAIVKGASVDVKQKKVPLRGQWKAPIDFGDADLDITIKIQHADFRASALAAVTTGATTATGSKLVAPGESQTISSTTFTVSQSATFVEDAGVYDVTAGKWDTRVASAPAAGQYSVAAGVYTFNAADNTHACSVFYSYSSASVGVTATFANQVQGPSTYSLLRVYNIYTIGGVVKPTGWEFPQVHFPSLSMALKVGDWTEQSLEAVASADLGQTLFKFYVGD